MKNKYWQDKEQLQQRRVPHCHLLPLADVTPRRNTVGRYAEAGVAATRQQRCMRFWREGGRGGGRAMAQFDSVQGGGQPQFGL